MHYYNFYDCQTANLPITYTREINDSALQMKKAAISSLSPQEVQALVDSVKQRVTESGIQGKVEELLKHVEYVYENLKNRNLSLADIRAVFGIIDDENIDQKN